MRAILRLLGIAVSCVLAANLSFGQSSSPGRFGIGLKGSLLGGGAEAAARVSHRANVRVGFNMFSYSHTFTEDGVPWNGQLRFRTVETHCDIFPRRRTFHFGPGLLIYGRTPITATAAFPAGTQNFTFGGPAFVMNDPSMPMRGHGNIKFRNVAPMATVGWGNLVSRNLVSRTASTRFTFPVELGAVFQGPPQARLSLAGNVCVPNPGGQAICSSVASYPTVQQSLLSEQNKINNSMHFLKVYPVVSFGFGYRF